MSVQIASQQGMRIPRVEHCVSCEPSCGPPCGRLTHGLVHGAPKLVWSTGSWKKWPLNAGIRQQFHAGFRLQRSVWHRGAPTWRKPPKKRFQGAYFSPGNSFRPYLLRSCSIFHLQAAAIKSDSQKKVSMRATCRAVRRYLVARTADQDWSAGIPIADDNFWWL